MSSIIFKNTILNTTNDDTQRNIWFNIEEVTRKQIKEGLLALLGSGQDLQIKNAGLCLAVIASVELPQNQWPEFLQTMVGNSANEVETLRYAAVQTLGFLSELMESSDLFLEQSEVEQMLVGTVNNIQPQQGAPNRICKIAIAALLRLIPLTSKNFEVEAQRNFIMNGIFTALAIDDEDV